MTIEKIYIKDIMYITLKGIIDKKTIKLLEKELYIIIDKIGIIKISINTNDAYFKENINDLLRKIKVKLILKGGTLYLVKDKRLPNILITYQNEYQVFNSNFI